jgi:DNA-binding MarR family transcriptional regulator
MLDYWPGPCIIFGMVRKRPESKQAVAAEVWRRLFQFFMHTRPQRDRVLAELELTPNDMRALSALDINEGRTMRSLADEWGCDASNATWIIDRLEELGFAERRSKPGDRRVKLVMLTDRGAKTLRRAVDKMWQLPPELLELSRKELDALRKVLLKLPTTSRPFGPTGNQG